MLVVIGANDVINPTEDDPSSPIYGMPVVKPEKKTLSYEKRDGKGYAAIENMLFYNSKTRLFRRCKNLQNLVNEVKSFSTGAENWQPRPL